MKLSLISVVQLTIFLLNMTSVFASNLLVNESAQSDSSSNSGGIPLYYFRENLFFDLNPDYISYPQEHIIAKAVAESRMQYFKNSIFTAENPYLNFEKIMLALNESKNIDVTIHELDPIGWKLNADSESASNYVVEYNSDYSKLHDEYSAALKRRSDPSKPPVELLPTSEVGSFSQNVIDIISEGKGFDAFGYQEIGVSQNGLQVIYGNSTTLFYSKIIIYYANEQRRIGDAYLILYINDDTFSTHNSSFGRVTRYVAYYKDTLTDSIGYTAKLFSVSQLQSKDGKEIVLAPRRCLETLEFGGGSKYILDANMSGVNVEFEFNNLFDDNVYNQENFLKRCDTFNKDIFDFDLANITVSDFENVQTNLNFNYKNSWVRLTALNPNGKIHFLHSYLTDEHKIGTLNIFRRFTMYLFGHEEKPALKLFFENYNNVSSIKNALSKLSVGLNSTAALEGVLQSFRQTKHLVSETFDNIAIEPEEFEAILADPHKVFYSKNTRTQLWNTLNVSYQSTYDKDGFATGFNGKLSSIGFETIGIAKDYRLILNDMNLFYALF